MPAGPGRPATPTNVKRLHGVRADRINDDEPTPSDRVIEAPEWLDAAALRIWETYAPDLIRTKVLTAWDVEAFAIWCDAVARHAEIAMRIREEGFVVVQGSGSTKVNPLVTAQKQFADTIKNYGARFGMTPSDRSSITVDQVKEGTSEADELLA